MRRTHNAHKTQQDAQTPIQQQWGNRTMADITFGHRTGHTPPATMNHPGQWHYLTTRLMAHMGAYSWMK